MRNGAKIKGMEKVYEVKYRSVDDFSQLTEQERVVVQRAKLAVNKAYAPYSSFHVGAAAMLDSGTIIEGSNQESEVFPSTQCAERTLLYYAQSQHVGEKITMLAIASMPDQRECYPCGGCRQALLDAERRQGAPIKVIMCGATTATIVSNAEALMPFSFKL